MLERGAEIKMMEILIGFGVIALSMGLVLMVLGIGVVFQSQRIPVWFKCVLGIVIMLTFSYLIGYGVLN